MTDLMERIRAYVAELPTHECVACGYEFKGVDIPCPDCGFPPEHHLCLTSEADALLREVAALEPKAYLVHGGRIYVDAVYIGEDYARSRIAQREDNAILTPLYRLTGDSHDPE